MHLLWVVPSRSNTRSCQYNQAAFRRTLDRLGCEIKEVETPKGIPPYWEVRKRIPDHPWPSGRNGKLAKIEYAKNARAGITTAVRILDRNIRFNFQGVQYN